MSGEQAAFEAPSFEHDDVTPAGILVFGLRSQP
jgi:hypothetical protein